MDVDDARGNARRIIPYVLEDLRARKQPPFGFAQKPQEAKFERRQRNVRGVVEQRVKIAVELRTAKSEDIVALFSLPSTSARRRKNEAMRATSSLPEKGLVM